MQSEIEKKGKYDNRRLKIAITIYVNSIGFVFRLTFRLNTLIFLFICLLVALLPLLVASFSIRDDALAIKN